MGVIIRADGSVAGGFRTHGLSRKDPEPTVLESEVLDARRLAKILTDIRREIADTRQAARGDWIEYEDVRIVASGGKQTLAHPYAGKVRVWVTAIDDNSVNDAVVAIVTTETTDNAVVLINRGAGDAVCTVRIERLQA